MSGQGQGPLIPSYGPVTSLIFHQGWHRACSSLPEGVWPQKGCCHTPLGVSGLTYLETEKSEMSNSGPMWPGRDTRKVTFH